MGGRRGGREPVHEARLALLRAMASPDWHGLSRQEQEDRVRTEFLEEWPDFAEDEPRIESARRLLWSRAFDAARRAGTREG